MLSFCIINLRLFYGEGNSYLSQNRWILVLLITPFAFALDFKVEKSCFDYSYLMNKLENDSRITNFHSFMQLYDSFISLIYSKEDIYHDGNLKTNKRGHKCKQGYQSRFDEFSRLIFWKKVIESHKNKCTQISCDCHNITLSILNDLRVLKRGAVMIIDKNLIKSKKEYILILYIHFLIDIKGDILTPYRYLKTSN